MLLLVCHTVAAQAEERFYAGAGIGASDIDGDLARAPVAPRTVDGSDTGAQFFAGYRLGRHGALELAYVDLGQLEYRGTASGKVGISGFNAAALALFPAQGRFELFAKAGLFAWQVEESSPSGAKSKGVDLSLGFGASYLVRKNAGVRVAWEHYGIDMDGANLLVAGVFLRFR